MVLALTAAGCARPVANEVTAGREPSTPGQGQDEAFDRKAEEEANRRLRAKLPERQDARLVTVTDEDVMDQSEGGDPRKIVGVETVWTYEVPAQTKCGIAEPFEAELIEDGWTQRSLETSGSDPTSNVRYSEFFLEPAHVALSVVSPPRTFAIRVQAHSQKRYPMTPQGDPFPAGDTACRQPDVPRVPQRPYLPGEKEAAHATNEAIYRGLPIPSGSKIVREVRDASASEFGDGDRSYGSGWQLALPPGRAVCEVVAEFEAAMASDGWERFTLPSNGSGTRNGTFFKARPSIAYYMTSDGILDLLVSENGAKGGRQVPRDEGTIYKPGATPESRGQPVPCDL